MSKNNTHSKKSIRNVYMDNASTTPLDPRVMRSMLPFFQEKFGNPSNLYLLGRQAKKVMEESTRTITSFLNCSEKEFIYTGSATEADNLAIAGVARRARSTGYAERNTDDGVGKIIISSIEHKGILSVCEQLKKEGFEIFSLPVNKYGMVDLNALAEALDDKTVLVSVTMADSETGTLQPIKEISKIIRAFRRRSHIEERSHHECSMNLTRGADSPASSHPSLPYFHTDASQAIPYEEIDVQKLGIDLMTLSAHKMGGPKGIGGLYIRKGVPVEPIIHGGGQQGGLRSGTENVPAIVGFAKAVELARKDTRKESVRVRKLRDTLENGIRKLVPKVIVNGHPTKRLPNFSNVSILDIEGEALLLHLDEAGIQINTGSACNSERLEPSYVLSSLGNPYEFIHGSLRFSLGKNTNKKDIDYVLSRLPAIVKKLRAISPLNLDISQKNLMNESSRKAFIGNRTPHFLRKKIKKINEKEIYHN